MRLVIVLVSLCYILKVCVLVEGRYLVEVRLNGYTNPTGRCRDCNSVTGLICCDTSGLSTMNCRGGCDSYFIYCLRPFGDARQSPEGCSESSNEYRTISSVNMDDRPLNFSQSRVLGLNNPQVLSGLEDIYDKGIQLYIEIIDEDQNPVNKPNELVDILLIDHNLTVAESRQQNYTGIYGFVTMNLTITVFCEGNFGGSDCTQCVPGFTGPDCNETDHCFGVDCSGNGECRMDVVDSFYCVCDPGFTGELCQTNMCVGVDCSGNGRCVVGVNNFTCECAHGFTGPLCSESAQASDSVTISASRLTLSGAALGGGISGALLLLIVILLLTTCFIAFYWTRKSKKMNHSDQSLQEQCDEADKELKSDHEFELKGNEAYSSTTHYIPTDDNVAYGQTTLQISTEDNIAYGQIPTCRSVL